jgi:Zn-dependent protease with chaperone function
MYALLGICLSLTGLLIISCLALLTAVVFWRLSARASGSWTPSARAQFLFLLRSAPVAVAILCVGALFLPSYLAYEPRQTKEVVTVKLALLAAMSLYGIGLAAWRGFATYLATRRLVRDWLRHAEPIQMENVAIPAFRLDHPFPIIAIVGALRPKLFIADQIFHALSDEEISAAVAHEIGHLMSGDNVKRGWLCACRDYLTIIPFGRSLERLWTNEAELAADEHAARRGALAALNLASALVKVARLMPSGSKPAVLVGATFMAQDSRSIRSRVLRLMHLAANSEGQPKGEIRVSTLAWGVSLSGLLLAAILTISCTNILAVIHSALERFVSILQ